MSTFKLFTPFFQVLYTGAPSVFFLTFYGELYAFGKNITVCDHLAKALILPIILGLAQFREVRARKHIKTITSVF